MPLALFSWDFLDLSSCFQSRKFIMCKCRLQKTNPHTYNSIADRIKQSLHIPVPFCVLLKWLLCGIANSYLFTDNYNDSIFLIK